jgi:hypothetical protein
MDLQQKCPVWLRQTGRYKIQNQQQLKTNLGTDVAGVE